MSSNGEMKTSLRLMICAEMSMRRRTRRTETDVLVLDMLEELELAVGAFAENGGAKGLHDLLDCDGRRGELILCGTVCSVSFLKSTCASIRTTHQTSPKAPMPTGCKSEYLTSPLAHTVPLRCAYDVVFAHTCS